MRSSDRIAVWMTSLFILLPGMGLLRAQQVVQFEDHLAKDRPEFWAAKLVASEVLMTSMGVPDKTASGTLSLGIEAGWLPSLSPEQRLVGFNGTKEENLNRTPLFARPRVMVGLPHDFSVTAGYVPPIPISGVKPNVLTLSVGRPVFSSSRARLGLRLHGLVGKIKGDITCDADTVAAGQDPIRNPYGCEAVSADVMRLKAIGLETAGGLRFSKRMETHLALGWNYFGSTFDVNARYSGLIDQTRLLGSGPAFSLAGGASYQVNPKTRVSGEIFYTPLDVRRAGQPRKNDGLVNLRATLWYQLR